MPHQIDQELCTGCGYCVSQCPVDAIYEYENKYQINASDCVDCQTCERVCPADAPTGGPKLNKELATK